ncbi:9875_t:CDS:2 [Funneliformis caledonium]|uniref:9875_t:CDS:1 n=1 Tax=Funneliformis caledonium TaxID=1117310 RepID=A0A9N9BJR5_9GLOM|nr:9875_t:CDS:2 [Funneliformis caledonium]
MVLEQMFTLIDSNWEDTKSKLSELFSNKVKRGTAKAFLLDIDMTKRLEYFDGWLLLYISDANNLVRETAYEVLVEICTRFLALNKDILNVNNFNERRTQYSRENTSKMVCLTWLFCHPLSPTTFEKMMSPIPSRKSIRQKLKNVTNNVPPDVLAELNQFNQDRLQDFFKGAQVYFNEHMPSQQFTQRNALVSHVRTPIR